MSAYHQLGHESWNLVAEAALRGFAGVILSPVNDSPANVVLRLAKLVDQRAALEVVLDPQFYKPTSDRGQLSTWAHIGNDIDTADLGDQAWWHGRCGLLVQAAQQVGANAVCSPALLPQVFSDGYYEQVVQCADALQPVAADAGMDVLLTAIVSLSEITQKGRTEQVASILSAAKASRIYLVLHDNLYPKTQRTNLLSMTGAAKLIRLLEGSGMSVLVAFSGLDFLVWKAAGASHVATGKFLNLRRFVPGRWDDPAEGGRVIPYWTDDSLITWLREDDLRLLDARGLMDRDAAAANPYSVEILQIVDEAQGKPWIGLAWRQYLYWFRQVELEVASDPQQSMRMLIAADKRWRQIEEQQIFLFDRENTGEWIRPWLNAITMSAG